MISRSLREGRTDAHSHRQPPRKCDLIASNSLGIFLLKYIRVSLCILYLVVVIQTIQGHCKISNVINLYKVKKKSSGPKASYYHPTPSYSLTVFFPKFLCFPFKKKKIEVFLIDKVAFNFCWTTKWLSYIYSFSQSFPLWFITGYWI